MYDRDPILSQTEAFARDKAVDIMRRIAALAQCSAMSDALFAAWMLGSISAATKNALSCLVPERDLQETVSEIHDDATRLSRVSHRIDAETISLFVPKPAS